MTNIYDNGNGEGIIAESTSRLDEGSTSRGNDFDEDYYENGLPSGKSLYQNYRWLPELTIPFAHKLIRTLDLRDGDRVLDFGCAKGFMVKALRLLNIDAYGCDISKYAIQNADPKVAEYCRLNQNGTIPFENIMFRQAIAKDVFEHVPLSDLEKVVSNLRERSDKLFVIVPLGDGEKYIVPQYELDVTHIHRQPWQWWEALFEEQGWRLREFAYLVPGLKDNWAHIPKGNGFFKLE